MEAETDFKEKFGFGLEVGKIAYEDDGAKYFFANFDGGVKKTQKQLPQNWSFRSFKDLDEKKL